MIATTLRGGLGNQMFQYAAGRALAARHGTDLVLDLSFLESRQDDVATPRAFALDVFAIEARTACGVRSWEAPPPGLGLRGRTASRWRRARSDYTVLRQKGATFQPAYFHAPDRTHLIGFWQSERYFSDCAETIRDELRAQRPLHAGASGVLARIRDTCSISMHVRRGDYVEHAPTGAYHGVLTLDYHRRALAEMRARTRVEPDVFVFSDDPGFCRRELDLGCETTIVDGEWPPEDDLRLMSECRHHIVANSSFSWWGAWLDARPDSVVVAPRRWIIDACTDTSHVVPATWTRVAS